ncbi:hypothetical protein CS063_16805 [Sporanaerobium hydrogeniformans]|uniref:Uncharacterized protein n=1 Tax=Sporanaerobium hydrogeniformans TaxID=3072179 RepID=A0AC61D9G2_9FIRM|nr:hypothetical protein [Sporanaerobium hydrogeniformans]PHV69247.1 hypothetical protein CS063_16805 [Sporanaerobium hydrogeniformans]
MAQGIIGGATSYEEQSLHDILSDINVWIEYTTERKQFIIQRKQQLVENKYWDKVPYDFQVTILSTISYFDTILFDLGLIRTAIDKDCISEKEVKLLRNIGRKSIEYNNEYPKTFKEDRRHWHDYGNPDFMIAEKLYGKGRDYFVTMQDAGNAAARLEDYMEKGQVTNNTLHIGGNVTNSQFQQGTVNSTQSMVIHNNFDYEQVLKTLVKINKSFKNSDFNEDFGDRSGEVKRIVTETIEMVNRKEEPTKIKEALSTLKDLAVGVTGSLIATGICGLITQLPIW